MSDLPSRDDVKANIALLRRNGWTHNIDAPLPFSSIVAAYVSGRLVDRETIDYKAAGKYLSTLIYDSEPDSTTRDEFLEYAMQEGRRIVAAAIGDTG